MSLMLVSPFFLISSYLLLSILLFLPPAVSVLQMVLVNAGQCDSVFKGFSDCLIQLGDNMANYPQDLDDRQNLHQICKYVYHKHTEAHSQL